MSVQSEPTIGVRSSKCECKAGNGHCSHSVGLLYVICHFLKMGLQAVPPIQCKTSLPQTWHIPPRSAGLQPRAVDGLAISKVAPAKKPSKKRRVCEGILPTVYCPVQQPIPCQEFQSQLLSNLKAINSSAQICSIISPDHQPDSVPSRFGPVPKGSVLSYQQRLSSVCNDIINHPEHSVFPPFPLPVQDALYTTVLAQEQQELHKGLVVSTELSNDIEVQTRNQTECKAWHDVRKDRLTSSVFKDVVCRRKDFDSLAHRLLHQKPIQTAAMKHGIKTEPKAAEVYADITGNSIFLCGFIINPSAHHLGTSPDRKVYDDQADDHYGLLEIKCPSKDSYTECKFLIKQDNGTYKLRRSSQYFHQVMGQMGLTGMPWCDFFVFCNNDYHKERVHFDKQTWSNMKSALDKFYFDFYLTGICKKHM